MIAAAGLLLKLSALVDDPEESAHYRSAAESTVNALIIYYLTKETEVCGGGVLTQGCYNHRLRLAKNAELTWGSCLLFECLYVLSGVVDPMRSLTC